VGDKGPGNENTVYKDDVYREKSYWENYYDTLRADGPSRSFEAGPDLFNEASPQVLSSKPMKIPNPALEGKGPGHKKVVSKGKSYGESYYDTPKLSPSRAKSGFETGSDLASEASLQDLFSEPTKT
jgi:hypothetical protein